MNDRLWVNEARTVLVRLWNNGTVEVARRATPAHTWGPPEYLPEEQQAARQGEDSSPDKEKERSL